VHRGERVEVARSEDTLGAFEKDRICVPSALVFLELDRDGGQSRLDLDRGRVVRAQQLAARFENLPAYRSLQAGIFYSFEEDAQVLQRGKAGYGSSRRAGAGWRAIHRQNEYSWLKPYGLQ
jgi:hypothetical protein